jgi:HEAT repeat protein
VVAGCVAILHGNRPADDQLLRALGGPAAEQILAGREGGLSGCWPRVWAARGLLHAWDDTATAALIHATADESWRVREMAAKVVARHRIGDALDAVAALRDDPVARVRQAAVRAVEIVTASGA